MSVLRKIDEHLEEVPMALLLILMVLCSGAQVFMRYVVNSSLAWSEELSRYSFVWSGFFAIGYAYRKGSSLRIDAFVTILPKKVQKFLGLFNDVLGIILFVILLRASGNVIVEMSATGQVSSAMRMPIQGLYMAPIVGFIIAIYRLIQSIVKTLMDIAGKKPDGGEKI